MTETGNGAPPSEEAVVLRCVGLKKHFGGVAAVDRVDLDLKHGEILALIGDNGAGKSTLVKMLCGALRPDAGKIYYRGEEVSFAGPLDARLCGIETVHQNLALIPTMDVAENLFLGREEVRKVAGLSTGVLRRRMMVEQSGQHLRELGVVVPATRGLQVDRLSGGQQQGVALGRALTWESGVLLMDEPTAALGVKQAEAVLNLARRVAERGSGVLFITHTLPYVMQFADRVIVMRHGRKVADMPRDEATAEGLVSLIVGVGLDSQDGDPKKEGSNQMSSEEGSRGDGD